MSHSEKRNDGKHRLCSGRRGRCRLGGRSGLALAGREVLVLEAASTVGNQTNARSSEVIHAGILSARQPQGEALRGRQATAPSLLRRTRGVHRRLGQLIVATRTLEPETLERYRANTSENGVRDLEWLDAREAARLEPAVRCVAALHCPSTGILDSHVSMQALQGKTELELVPREHCAKGHYFVL